ncbi:MAG: phage tail tape measure protein [Bacteroidales bacterium]|nr:phage tail tape measure protein [Bacteroidales bacterium]
MAGSNYTYTVALSVEDALASMQSMMKDMQGVITKVVDLQESLDNAANKGGQSLCDTFDRIGKSAFNFVNIKDTIDRITGALDDMSEPGLKLNAAMHSLSAVSGVTGAGLKQIEDYARKAAKTFGGSASDSVEAYQLVLSQLGPHIAQVPEALAAMGNSIKTTSKLMGNDTTAAAEVLTTALNQYQVSLDDPIKASEEMARMMNVMAAAGQAGSAELPTIGEALKQSGMMAKAAGVSFEELNAAIQMLDKAGKKGSEGGVALRNVMGTLAKGRFLPKDVKEELDGAGVSINTLTDKSLSMTDRLRALTPVMNDSALLSKLFGQANASAAVALIASLDPIDELTKSISGSNSAYEQAGVIMESDMEKMSRFQAKIDDVKIRLYGLYSGVLPYVKGLSSTLQMTANIAMTANAMHTVSEMSLFSAIRRRTAAMLQSANVTGAAAMRLGFFNTAVVLARRFTASFTQELHRQRFAAIRAQLSTMGAGASIGFFSKMAIVGRIACGMLAAGFNAVSKAIYNIPLIGWVLAGIAALVAAFKLLWNKCEGFRRLLFGVWESIKAIFHNIGVVFSVVWDNALKPVFQGIGNAFTWLWEGIKTVFSRIRTMFVNLKNGIVNIFQRIIEPIRAVLDRLKGMFRAAFDKIIEWISKPFKWIKELWNKVFKNDKFEDVGEAYRRGAEKGSESFRKSKQNGNAALASGSMPGTDDESVTPVVGGASQIQKITMNAGLAGMVDLNNVKGSTNYTAVAAKLQAKSFAGLGGGANALRPTIADIASGNAKAAMPELPSFLDESQEDKQYSLLQRIANDVSKIAAGITIAALPAMPLAAQPVQMSAKPSVQPVTAQWTPAKAQTEKTGTYVAKFCDKVEINVPAGTTAAQVDSILNELMRRINDVAE